MEQCEGAGETDTRSRLERMVVGTRLWYCEEVTGSGGICRIESQNLLSSCLHSNGKGRCMKS